MITRRKFLEKCGVAVISASVPAGFVAFWRNNLKQKREQAKAVIFELAKKYQRFVSKEDKAALVDAHVVVDSLVDQFDRDGTLDTVSQAFKEKVQKEFGEGRLTYHDGWPISVTEAKLVQIAATLPAA